MIRLRIRCYLQKLVLENLILHPVLTKKNLLSLSKNMIYDLRCSFRGIEMYLEQALKNAMTRVDSCIQVLGLKIAQKIHSLLTWRNLTVFCSEFQQLSKQCLTTFFLTFLTFETVVQINEWIEIWYLGTIICLIAACAWNSSLLCYRVPTTTNIATYVIRRYRQLSTLSCLVYMFKGWVSCCLHVSC